jgi:hypothetical protein
MNYYVLLTNFLTLPRVRITMPIIWLVTETGQLTKEGQRQRDKDAAAQLLNTQRLRAAELNSGAVTSLNTHPQIRATELNQPAVATTSLLNTHLPIRATELNNEPKAAVQMNSTAKTSSAFPHLNTEESRQIFINIWRAFDIIDNPDEFPRLTQYLVNVLTQKQQHMRNLLTSAYCDFRPNKFLSSEEKINLLNLLSQQVEIIIREITIIDGTRFLDVDYFNTRLPRYDQKYDDYIATLNIIRGDIHHMVTNNDSGTLTQRSSIDPEELGFTKETGVVLIEFTDAKDYSSSKNAEKDLCCRKRVDNWREDCAKQGITHSMSTNCNIAKEAVELSSAVIAQSAARTTVQAAHDCVIDSKEWFDALIVHHAVVSDHIKCGQVTDDDIAILKHLTSMNANYIGEVSNE